MAPKAEIKTKPHAGAGVPWRRPSAPTRAPSFFGPSCVFSQKGAVVYGSYVDELLAILPASGVVAERKFVHSNHLYSVAALTDNSGAVVERYRYSAYGERTVLAADGVTTRSGSLYGNQYGFTGRYLDKETNLWYFRARYYSGSLGRFVNRDPVLGSAIQRDGLDKLSATLSEYGTWAAPKAMNGYGQGASMYAAYFLPDGVDPSGHYKVNKCEIVVFNGHNDTVPQGPGGRWWPGPLEEDPCSASHIVSCVGSGSNIPATPKNGIPGAPPANVTNIAYRFGYKQTADAYHAGLKHAQQKHAPSLCDGPCGCKTVRIFIVCSGFIPEHLAKHICGRESKWNCTAKAWDVHNPAPKQPPQTPEERAYGVQPLPEINPYP